MTGDNTAFRVTACELKLLEEVSKQANDFTFGLSVQPNVTEGKEGES